MDRVTVLPDNATFNDIDETTEKNALQFTNDKLLPVAGKVKERSLIIFTFGDRIQAITVTANDGFVRAAKQQVKTFI